MSNKVIYVGAVPRINYGKQHQQDFVQDARGISGAIVASTHGSVMHFTKTMVIYDTL